MISKEEIKKMADLARIEVGEEEVESLRGEIDSILNYVNQVSEIPSPEQGEGYATARGEVNIMRKDQNPTESGTYSKELITEFPNKEGNYLKVKKIL